MPQKLNFDIIHVSGSDEGHSGKQLEFHSPTTRGWQSLRFCEYPQEIIFALREPCNIKKIQILSHQHNIASKIEIFIGTSAHCGADSLRDCKFTRLGYVHLSANEGTNFQARELKTVMIERDGVFVKMLVHKNYVNKFNLFNQVCIVAVNILGHPFSKTFDTEASSNYLANDEIVNYFMHHVTDGDDLNSAPLNALRVNHAGKNISPYDDLLFDMYQDAETAQLIRKLDTKKQEAIIEERYDYAKKLKAAIADLYKVGEKLGRFEVEKRRAVEVEDFDAAKKKKIESDEYRLHVYKQLDIYDLLELPKRTQGVNKPRSFHTDDSKGKMKQRVEKQTADIKLPPVILNSSTNEKHVEEKTSQVQQMPVIFDKTMYDEVELTNKPSDSSDMNDERPLPSLNKKTNNHDQVHDINRKEMDLQPLSEKEEREAELIIEIFGINVAQQLYSKSWKYRQDSIMSVTAELQDSSDKTADRNPKDVSRAVVSVLRKSMNDQVLTVLTESVRLLKVLLQGYIPRQSLGKTEMSFVIDKLLPVMLKRAGDAVPRTKTLMSDFIVEIANFPESKGVSAIQTILTEPLKSKKQPPWRILKSQIEVLTQLVKDVGVDVSGGLSSERIMRVLLSGLQHPNSDVRDAAITCIVEVYKIIKEPLKSYFPPDDLASRKNPLYVKLFDTFDRADGKPTEVERKAASKKDREMLEKNKQDEVNALKAQLAETRQMVKEQQEQQEQPTIEANNNEMPTSKKLMTTGTKKRSLHSRASIRSRSFSQRKKEVEHRNDRMCIFCGESSDAFDSNGLDVHYWKSCPMLKRCDRCPQVVEVSCMSDHLLSECDMKRDYIQCHKCGLAVDKNSEQQHKNNSTCKALNDPEKITCPLCGVAVLDAEEAWKSHLVGKCRVNLQRIKKHGTSTRNQNNSQRGRSQIPRGGRGKRSGASSTPSRKK